MTSCTKYHLYAAGVSPLVIVEDKYWSARKHWKATLLRWQSAAMTDIEFRS